MQTLNEYRINLYMAGGPKTGTGGTHEAFPNDPADDASPVTQLLVSAAAGDAEASSELLSMVYDQLRAIARQRMAGERQGHTLQATALVHEAYMRLLGKAEVPWGGRGHFFRAAAEAMRRILIDHARARNADKRGGGKAALAIMNVTDLAAQPDSAGILALDDAMSRFEKVDPQAAAVVRLRFYAGLGEEAVAQTLGLSTRTVRRDWAFARGWLRETLEREGDLECPKTPRHS